MFLKNLGGKILVSFLKKEKKKKTHYKDARTMPKKHVDGYAKHPKIPSNNKRNPKTYNHLFPLLLLPDISPKPLLLSMCSEVVTVVVLSVTIAGTSIVKVAKIKGKYTRTF